MEIRPLRYFIAVAEQLSFTAAAASLRVAQPSLSRQIQQFEQELGVQLFFRDRRNVHLTDAGRTLVEEARVLVAQSERFVECARQMQKGTTGLVRVGGFEPKERLSPALVGYQKEFPGVELTYQYVPCDHQSEALKQGKIDVGIMVGLVDSVDSAHLFTEHLFEEAFAIVLPKSNKLARQPHLSLRQVKLEPLVLPERSPLSAVHDKILELYRRAGVEPKIIHTQLWPHPEAAWLLISSGAGIGVGVFPPFTGTITAKRTSFVPLHEPDAKIDVNMVWRKNEGAPAVLAFLNFLRRIFKPGTAAAAPPRTEVQRMLRGWPLT